MVAILPFVGPSFGHINRLLSKHNLKTLGLPPRKVVNFLRPVKNDLRLRRRKIQLDGVPVGLLTGHYPRFITAEANLLGL